MGDVASSSDENEVALLRHLTPEQRETWLKHRFFKVVVDNTTYYVAWGRSIWRLAREDESGGTVTDAPDGSMVRLKEAWCVQPWAGNHPDIAITRLFHLMYNLAETRAIAGISGY